MLDGAGNGKPAGCDDGLMERETARRTVHAEEKLVELVDVYSRRVYPAVLEQHASGSVCSPLGVWLLLAACVTGAGGVERAELELAVGCSADEASELLEAFLSEPPPALKAAIAVWVRIVDATRELAAWVERLPSAVESGFMPTQQHANEWVDRHTLGLIKQFPLAVDSLRIALASALATRVSWKSPFDLVAASEHLSESSPWRGSVERVLWDKVAVNASLTETSAAGVVAVHEAVAQEGLTVISVSADPSVDRVAVLEAAHEIAAHIATGAQLPRCSLFALPLGDGHSWTITEREKPSWHAGQQSERIAGVSLPAWHLNGELELKRSARFAAVPALEVLRQLIGPRPDDQTEAKQVAVASFTRYGFQAAALTVFAVRASAVRNPNETGTERTAIVRFDHPYAAVAISGHPNPPSRDTRFAGLPLFSAWIATPVEAEDHVESS